MSILLYELLPLRTSRDLGDYNKDVKLAHWYGDLTKARVDLLKITDNKWFVADHPMEVTNVYINDTLENSWERALESDDKGHTWTVINLNTAAQEGDVVSASGYGKAHPISGEVMSNPAEIIQDVLGMAGRSDQWWGQLRNESAAAGIHLAGVIKEASSVRAQIDEIAASAGGIWSYGQSRLYPSDTVTGLLTILDKYQVSDLKTSASLTDTADILHLSFDYDYSTNRPQRFIELTASPKRFNDVKVELTLPWLRGTANAESVGRRILQRLAGERYDVSFNTTKLSVRAGDWVQLIAHPLWPFAGDPLVMVTEVNVTPWQLEVQVVGECVISYPTIRMTAHTLAIPSTKEGGSAVDYADGIATFTFLDLKNSPLAGARVSLDGQNPRTTDAQGVVQFSASPGAHTLTLQAVGYQAMEYQITLG